MIVPCFIVSRLILFSDSFPIDSFYTHLFLAGNVADFCLSLQKAIKVKKETLDSSTVSTHKLGTDR